MRILILTHSFNSLTQRLHAELAARGHELSVEFDIADSVAEEAVAAFAPDLVLAPYLRRAIPESIWAKNLCLVVHPGIVGDRGPSALDWAILEGEPRWGVTVLQANAVMDGGDVWASVEFDLPPRARKGSVYRGEVTDAAVTAVLAALETFPDWRAGRWQPTPLTEASQLRGPNFGHQRPLMKQADRAIDWLRDDTATVLKKINAGDGFPGVADSLFGEPCHLFDARAEAGASSGEPGALLARRETALLRKTVDGAVWIGHVKRGGAHPFKLPATLAFADRVASLPESPPPGIACREMTWQDIRYQEAGEPGARIGFLSFDFYNGAMSTEQCRRLTEAYREVAARDIRVLVLEGGSDFWSNGIHLNVIEAAEAFGSTPADESWANINAIDDLALAIIESRQLLTIAAVNGNCGAGGCFLARAADFLWLRDGVVLNPHYKNMGNLFGSEYWTYLLPPRVGAEGARALMQDRLPLLAKRAVEIGFADGCLTGDRAAFRVDVARRAAELAGASDWRERVEAKRLRREQDEAAKPLAQYRAEELAAMRRNFYGFDPSYHVARYHFVMKSPQSWTPRHLARHRDIESSLPKEPA